MKVWNTKYALTTGITEEEGEISGKLFVKYDTSKGYYLHGENNEWHRTKDAAVNRAEEMRIKKLISLDKKIKKISALTFD